MTQNKSELRISMLFLFWHCFMLPSPTPLSHDFNNFKCYPCRFLSKFFFLRITARRIFFRQVSLAEIFFWELSPHLRLFLIVRPLGPMLFFQSAAGLTYWNGKAKTKWILVVVVKYRHRENGLNQFLEPVTLCWIKEAREQNATSLENSLSRFRVRMNSIRPFQPVR